MDGTGERNGEASTIMDPWIHECFVFVTSYVFTAYAGIEVLGILTWSRPDRHRARHLSAAAERGKGKIEIIIPFRRQCAAAAPSIADCTRPL